MKARLKKKIKSRFKAEYYRLCENYDSVEYYYGWHYTSLVANDVAFSLMKIYPQYGNFIWKIACSPVI